MSGEQEPEWAQRFFNSLATRLIPGRVSTPADLDELRLLVDATRGPRWTMELVRRLLDLAAASEPDERGHLLEEVDGLLGKFAPDEGSDADLLEVRARKLLLEARPVEAYEQLADRYADALAQRSGLHWYPELLVAAAREAGRTADLRCIVDAHRPAGALDPMLHERVVEMLDATPPA